MESSIEEFKSLNKDALDTYSILYHHIIRPKIDQAKREGESKTLDKVKHVMTKYAEDLKSQGMDSVAFQVMICLEKIREYF